MSNESPPSPTEPQERTGGGGGRGCGCLLAFLLVFVAISLYKGQSFAEIFGRLLALADFLLWIALHIGRLLFAYGVTIFVLVALFHVVKAINTKKEGKNQAIDYIARFLPVKTLSSIGSFFADSHNTLRQVLSGETIWFGPLFALLLTVAALDGLQSLLSLPPMKASAAGVIYQASVDQSVAEEKPLLMWAAPLQLYLHATQAQLKTSQQRLAESMWTRLHEEWSSDVSISREVMRESIYPGISTLGIYLEWVYGVRTSDDLLATLPSDFSGRARIKSAADEFEHTTKWEQLMQDGFLAVLVIPFAFFLWLGSGRSHSFLRTVGVSSILWTMTFIVGTLVYISSALVHMLWVAHLLETVAEFITLQIWLIAVLPAAAGLSRLRSWLLGTTTFLVMQLGGGALILWMFGVAWPLFRR